MAIAEIMKQLKDVNLSELLAEKDKSLLLLKDIQTKLRNIEIMLIEICKKEGIEVVTS